MLERKEETREMEIQSERPMRQQQARDVREMAGWEGRDGRGAFILIQSVRK